jgi:hypothetical protein
MSTLAPNVKAKLHAPRLVDVVRPKEISDGFELDSVGPVVEKESLGSVKAPVVEGLSHNDSPALADRASICSVMALAPETDSSSNHIATRPETDRADIRRIETSDSSGPDTVDATAEHAALKVSEDNSQQPVREVTSNGDNLAQNSNVLKATAKMERSPGSCRPKKVRILTSQFSNKQHQQRMKKCGDCPGCLTPDCLR